MPKSLSGEVERNSYKANITLFSVNRMGRGGVIRARRLLRLIGYVIYS